MHGALPGGGGISLLLAQVHVNPGLLIAYVGLHCPMWETSFGRTGNLQTILIQSLIVVTLLFIPKCLPHSCFSQGALVTKIARHTRDLRRLSIVGIDD